MLILLFLEFITSNFLNKLRGHRFMKNKYEKKLHIQNSRAIRVNEIIKAFMVVMLCTVASIICFLSEERDIYKIIAILPITYCIVFCILLFPTAIKSKSYTVIIFTVCCALRYVLHPTFLSLYPVYGFSGFANSDLESINKAIYLMLYELIVCSYFLYFRAKKMEEPERNIGFPDGTIIINMFIIVALIVAISVPESRNSVNLFIMKPGTGVRMSSMGQSTFGSFMTQIFQIGRLALYISIVVLCKNKFNIRHKKRYIMLALVVSIINLGIIIGEARSVQVQFAFASAYLLSQCFPQQKKKIIKSIAITAGLILILMTIYKHFYAFQYDSYLSTVSNIELDNYEITRTAEVYLLGPQTVSSAMKLKNQDLDYGLKRLLFDFARSFMGLNFIVKKFDMQTTTVIYNLFVSNGLQTNGYLLPITAQGYLYFGWILSPVLLCLFLSLSLHLEKTFRSSESAYTIFFAAYVFARSSTCVVASNINSVITNGSMILLSAGSIYLIQKILPVRFVIRKSSKV